MGRAIRETQQPTDMSRDQVLNWLAKQGYPFELRVGQTLRQAGWDVSHAQWYTDPQTGKLRELDLLADIDAVNTEVGYAVFVQLAVECKHSPDKPWVVFTTQHQKVREWVGLKFGADEMSRQVIQEASLAKVALPPLLRFADRVGHGAVKAFRDEKQREDKFGDPTSPFAALQSVISAAIAGGGEYTSGVMDDTSKVLPITIPIIVLGGTLYEFFVDGDGKEALEEVGSIQVIVGRSDGEEVYVTVMTHEYLKANAKRMAIEMKEFCQQLVPLYDALTRSLRDTGPTITFVGK